MGLISCIDAVHISTKIRRIVMFSAITYLFVHAYAGLLRSSNQNQLNLLEAVLRKKVNVFVILGSEFVLLLLTKTVIFSLFHEIVKTLYRMVTGRPTRRAARRRETYIYVPNDRRHPSPVRKNPAGKRVKFAE